MNIAKANHKPTDKQISRVNYLIETLSKYLSSEFNRKGRSSQDLGRWKATKLRTFLVYTGLVIWSSATTRRRRQWRSFWSFFTTVTQTAVGHHWFHLNLQWCPKFQHVVHLGRIARFQCGVKVVITTPFFRRLLFLQLSSSFQFFFKETYCSAN